MLKIFLPTVNFEHIDGVPRNPTVPVFDVSTTASKDPIVTVPNDAGSDGFMDLTGGNAVIDDDLSSFKLKAQSFLKKYGIYVVAALLVAFMLKGKKA